MIRFKIAKVQPQAAAQLLPNFWPISAKCCVAYKSVLDLYDFFILTEEQMFPFNSNTL